MLPPMDRLFGPVLPGHFDFTLLFELSMLGLVPAGIAILTTPFYLKTALKATRQVRPGLLLGVKIAAGVVLVAAQLATVFLWKAAQSYHSDVTLAASIMSVLASVCVVTIIYITHTYNIRSSAFLSVFLTVTMLFDITIARSCLLRETSLDAIGYVQIAAASLKLSLVILEEIPKRSYFYADELRNTTAPEDVSGFWARALLIWVNPILKLGYSKTFTVDELPRLGTEFSPEALFDRFSPQWEKSQKTSARALILSCLRTIPFQFLAPIIPRLCFMGFSLSRPFLMQCVIDVVKEGGASPEVVNGLIGATLLVFGGLMISRSIFERLEFQTRTCVRGILIVAIYSKMQTLAADQLANSAALTLMSADVNGVNQALQLLHTTWASIIELALGIYVLYGYVGAACFLIFVPTTLSSLATARSAWNAKTQDRLAATSNVLAQTKSIKAMGLTKVLAKYLQGKCADEIQTSLQERNARILTYAIYAFGNSMAPVSVLAGARFWTRASSPMAASEVFATYAVIFIVSLPLSVLLGNIPVYSSGYACIMRIQNFLTVRGLRDQRECQTAEEEKANAEAARPPKYAVRMNNVSVRNDISGSILRDVSVRIPTGSSTMVHGAVGSGKSAFLNTLLGELEISSGTIDVATKRIGYASQVPWLRNLTVQDNIIGPHPFIESLYRDIIRACDLEKDLQDLPDGDQTLVGSNGCNLSGGQKQRLGLARTLFAQTSIMIFDDVFSSLDLKTALTIYERLLGNDGLLRKWKTTVIMTTSRLHSFESSDLTLEINQKGRVRESNPAQTHRQREALPRDQPHRPPTTTNQPAAMNSAPIGGLQPAQKERRDGDLTLYSYLLQSTSSIAVGVWILITAVAATLERMPQIFMRIWLSVDAANDKYFIGFVALAIGDIIVTSAAGTQFLWQIAPKSSQDLHWRLLQTVLEATFPFLSHTDAGSLLNRFGQDVALMSQRLPLHLLTTVSMGFNVLVDINIIATGSRFAAPLIVFIVAMLYAIQHFYLKTSRQLHVSELETASPLFTHFTESSTGISHIRSLAWKESFFTDFLSRLKRSQKPFYYLLSIQQWLTLMLDLMTLVIAVTLVSISLLYPESTSDSGIGLALLNLISFSSTVSFFLRHWVSLESSLGSVARIKEFREDTPQEKDHQIDNALPENWPTTGKIEFESVTACYRKPDGHLRIALDNASIAIQHGHKVGISGRTGSGKSSMLLALLHLMEFSGSIWVDDREIKTIPRHILRSRITTLTQDGIELKGSLRLNIYPYDTKLPSDEEMRTTLQSVGLWNHISKRGGLDVDMSEVKFSHGQKQLLFIARAILHQKMARTKIVLIDEATASLDSDTDARIQQLVDESFIDCTVLTISHQRPSFHREDLSIEFDSGIVIQQHHGVQSPG